MIKYKKGDILEATENIICHQVNEDGVMGGGLALQITTQYPNVEKEYQAYCEHTKDKGEDLYGEWHLCQAYKQYWICNCFTQQNFNTRYDLIKKVFTQIKSYCQQRDLSVCVPYKYGCGISNGNWEEVEQIFKDIFTDYDLTIYRKDQNEE